MINNTDALREAAQAVIERMTSTYRARNGREVGIQADDGEKCWIVHSDEIHALEAALAAHSHPQQAIPLPVDVQIVTTGSSNHGCTVEIQLPGGDRHREAREIAEWLRARSTLPPQQAMDREAVRSAISAGLDAGTHLQLHSDKITMIEQRLAPFLSPTALDAGNCDLCAGKCRGHGLADSASWEPEPSSRAYVAPALDAEAPEAFAVREAAARVAEDHIPERVGSIADVGAAATARSIAIEIRAMPLTNLPTGSTEAGLSQAGLVADPYDDHGNWHPKIGQEVRVSEGYAHHADWQRDRLWVAGVEPGKDGLNITVAHEWPAKHGLTDGFWINRPFKTDDLVPVRAALSKIQPKGELS